MNPLTLNATGISPLVRTAFGNRTLSEIVVGSTTLCLIITLTICGNTLVIMSILNYRPLRKVQNFFLISLAGADLAVAVTVMPFHVAKFITGKWIFGWHLCQMWITFDIWLCTSSILNLCAIALDRYWAIHYPIKYANKRTLCLVLSMTGLAWLISALISVPPLFGWNDWSQQDDFTKAQCEYTTQKGYVIYSACGSFFIPLVIMTTVYAKIFYAARQRLRGKKRASTCSVDDIEGVMRKPSVQPGMTRTDSTRLHPPGQNEDCDDSTRIHGQDQLHLDDSLDHFKKFSSVTMDNKMSTASAPFITTMSSIRSKNSVNTQNSIERKRGSLSLAMRRSIKNPFTRRVQSKSNEYSESEKFEDSNLRNFFKQRERISVSKEKKAAKTLAIIMGVFVLCWFPFFALYLIQPFCGNCIHPKIFESTNWLGYINSCLNPVIYTIFNLDFRKSFKKIISQVLDRCKTSSCANVN